MSNGKSGDREQTSETEIGKAAPAAPQAVSVALRLQPVENSQQPVFANFTSVQAGSGVVYIDFGFLDPQTMAGLARLGQPGVKAPEAISGTLACRTAMSLETTASLANQLNHLLRGAAAAQAHAAQPAAPLAEPESAGPVQH